MGQPGTDISRAQSLGEELANSISHGIGLIAAIVGMPFLVISALDRGEAAGIVGASIFGATVMLLYLSSTVYHALPQHPAKEVLRIVDHGAIYLLIAGTYTPFTLGVLYGPWGWTLFGIVWALAALGITLKTLGGIHFPILSTVLYLAMGWVGVIAIKPLWHQMPSEGFAWLLAGGLAYTAGVAFYAAEGRRYMHFVWHLFVIAGTTCHFFAVLWYAA